MFFALTDHHHLWLVICPWLLLSTRRPWDGQDLHHVNV